MVNTETWYEATARMAQVMVKLGYFKEEDLKQMYNEFCRICAMDADLELLSYMINALALRTESCT